MQDDHHYRLDVHVYEHAQPDPRVGKILHIVEAIAQQESHMPDVLQDVLDALNEQHTAIAGLADSQNTVAVDLGQLADKIDELAAAGTAVDPAELASVAADIRGSSTTIANTSTALTDAAAAAMQHLNPPEPPPADQPPADQPPADTPPVEEPPAVG